MGSPYLLYLIILSFVIGFFFSRYTRKEIKNYDELLRFFPPGKKLHVPEVAEIIKSRTNGRRDLSDGHLYNAFNQLCEEGKLCKEEKTIEIMGRSVNSITYFISEKK